MSTSIPADSLDQILSKLRTANQEFATAYPGEPFTRQAVHSVYGGAQIFKADTAPKLGVVALTSLKEYGGDFVTFAKAVGLRGSETLPKTAAQVKALTRKLEKNADAVRATSPAAWLAYTVYQRILAKLQSEPVEDFRIDFEDGYGNRPDAEEDGHAAFAAEQVAAGMKAGTLPPFIGIRIKPLTEELKARSLRTLDIFLSTLSAASGKTLPDHFVVTLPKVVTRAHVDALVAAFEILEAKGVFAKGSLKVELMMETPQSIINDEGRSSLTTFLAAAKGRCVGVHFGVYDYTALAGITASYQAMRHPACDFARHMMKVALAQTGVHISDGATNIMPVGHHRAVKGGKPLTAKQKAENVATVHRAWKLAFDDNNHSLMQGYYQGWDLHPAQFPVRYAAIYAFFLEELAAASHRLKTFIEKAAQASLIGDVFDDAATGQGLLNFFLRGISCGAITEDEARLTGLTIDELRSRSFVKILNARRGK